MNYRHIFHAGNFCDVVKHTVLCLILEKLREKETPFEVLDTHGGIGLYDLTAASAQKTLEYENGIARYLTAMNNPSTPPSPHGEAYRQIVASMVDDDGILRRYPGSPYLIRRFLRPVDRLWACEWHPDDYEALRQLFLRDRIVHVRHQDGYEAMGALLPFKARRGLVLMDPPFEQRSEWSDVCRGLQKAMARFPYGQYAIWFPVKAPHVIRSFYKSLKEIGLNHAWAFQFLIQNASRHPDRLNGCGMVLINPPWQIQDKIRHALTALLPVFSIGEEARLYCDWIVKKD